MSARPSSSTHVVVFLVVMFAAGVAWSDTLVFRQGLDGYTGVQDTFLKQAVPSSTFGWSTVVEWDGEDGGGQNFGLLRFDDIFGTNAGQIPPGSVIASATITYDVINSGNTASVNEVVADWSQGNTYNTFGGDPGVQADEYAAFVGTASGSSGTRSFDVTTSLAAWSNAPSSNKGWIFRPTGGTDGVEFRSSDNTETTSRPTLTVVYVELTGVAIVPEHIDTVAGGGNEQVTVLIPPGSNDTSAVNVTLTTDNAAVAVPVGATGPSLIVPFPVGGPTQQNVGIDIGAAGSAEITSTNDAGLTDDNVTVSVGAGAVSIAPTQLIGFPGASSPITVSITPGSNDTRAVAVTLTTDDASVALPSGAVGDSLVLDYVAGAPTAQSVDVDFGSVGGATISTSNGGGLADTTLPVEVGLGFRFTATADMRSQTTRFEYLLAAMNAHVGGEGAFHVSPGDIDPIPPVRTLIDTYCGADAIWYPGIGNHEEETAADMAWLRDEFNNGNGVRTPLGDPSLTNADGPASTIETTYSWDYGNARFIMLNEYWNGSSDTGTDGDVIPALLAWLADRLAENTNPVVFVFGHEPAYPFNRHVGDSLDKYPANRDAFWALLDAEGVQAYICGHTHVYTKYRPTPGGAWQVDLGNAGNDSSEASDPQTFADITVTNTAVRYDIWRSTAVGSATYTLEDTWTEPIKMAKTSAGFYEQGWNLTSVPIAADDPDPVAVFADLAALGNTINNNLYRYAPGAGYKIYPSADFTRVVPGEGYWLYLTAAGASDVVTVAGELAAADVVLPLAGGWQMVGHPHTVGVLWSDCELTDGVDTKTLAEAVAAGWIEPTAYYYETGAGYGLVKPDGSGDDDTLRPWRGYWVLANQAGLDLIIPPPG